METPENVMTREMAALAALKAGLQAVIDDEPDMVVAIADGQTGILEALDALIAGDALDAGLIEGVDLALKALSARKQRFARRADMRRALIEQALTLLEQTKLERPGATLSLVKRPAGLAIEDESLVPVRFWKTPDPVLDRSALKAALAAGEAVDGARLDPAPATLTIRRS